MQNRDFRNGRDRMGDGVYDGWIASFGKVRYALDYFFSSHVTSDSL